jgi:hypothetical protein
VVAATSALDEGRFADTDRRCLQDAVHDRVSPSLCRVQRMTPPG